jgi:hypothetical protein
VTYLWFNLKDKVYRMILSSHAEEELKEKLGTEVLEVSREELLQENFNLFKLY